MARYPYKKSYDDISKLTIEFTFQGSSYQLNINNLNDNKRIKVPDPSTRANVRSKSYRWWEYNEHLHDDFSILVHCPIPKEVTSDNIYPMIRGSIHNMSLLIYQGQRLVNSVCISNIKYRLTRHTVETIESVDKYTINGR